MSRTVTGTESIRQDLNRSALDLFWKFITERQQIWFRRVVENEPLPWTDDEILNNYRFTNVYRQLDPGTQYVIQDILETESSRRNKIFNVMMYRLIGRLETHKFLGFQQLESFEPSEFEERLKRRRDVNGEKIFTGAYMVAGYSRMGSSDKVENVAALFGEIASHEEYFQQLVLADSAKEAYDLIRKQPGFGNFLSYQVLVDLLYPVEYYDGDSILPFSANDWSSPGPGAQKGLNRLVDSFDKVTQLEVMRWLQEHQQEEFSRLNLDFPYLLDKDGEKMALSLADIQNCLCEFYKYHKILNSEGRARRRFRDSEKRPHTKLRSIYETAPNISIN